MKKSHLITLVKEVLQDFYNSKGNTPVDWEKRDWELYEENKITYLRPNFDAEWEEAVRYPEFNNMGKEQWIRKARVGGPIQYSQIKNVLGNVDLNFEDLEEPKKQRFQAAFQKGVIEMPIAVKFSNDDYDLVAGNTRLSGLVKNGIDPKIWVVNLSNLRENYVLQDLEDKFDIDLDLHDDGKSLTLSRIVIPKDKRGQGVGSKVMKLITQYADAQNKLIYLTPSKDFGATSTGRLEQFYKQFGFKKKDRSDFSTKETMVREPQTSENFADEKVKDEIRRYIDDYTEIEVDILKKLLKYKKKYPKQLDPRTGGNKYGYRGTTFDIELIKKLKVINKSNGVTEYQVPSGLKITSKGNKGFLSFSTDEEVAQGFGDYSGHFASLDKEGVGGYVRVSLDNPNFILHPDFMGELSKELEYSKESEKETLFIGNTFEPDRIYVLDKYLYNENFADGKVKEGTGGADTAWIGSDDEKITLQDILNLTKDIKVINYPTQKLANIVLNWNDNPEEIERISQVEISSQYPILIMVDEQNRIQWILDGNHRAQKALRAKARTIPAKLIKPSDLDAKAKKILLGITENFADGKVNESGYEEAWELLGQPAPEIKNFVKQLGLKNDDATAKKIGDIIDNIKDTSLPANKIPKLKNLANKGNDSKILKAIKQISGKPDAEQQYIKLMQARDAGEKRNRGYNVSDLIKAVKSGNYEPPVLLQLPSGLYVIGGRTRLYAALALGITAKVKIISSDTFKQVKENYADGKVKGKSRPGRVKKAGASCKGSVTDLRAKAKKYGGEKGKMYHWCANMKSGKK